MAWRSVKTHRDNFTLPLPTAVCSVTIQGVWGSQESFNNGARTGAPRNAVALMHTYEGVSKNFRTGRLEREVQMVQLSLPLGADVPLFCESV